MKNIFFLSFLAMLLMISDSRAQTSFKNELGFQSDNDAYLALGQDRYYTNGLFVTFRHATDQAKLSGSVNKKIWEAEAGQQMYNPFTGNISNINSIDRPFAGYLYVGGSLKWLYQSENSLKLTVRASRIGPSARGKEVQEKLHQIVGFYPIRGWEYQVNDEAGVNTTLAYNYFLYRNKTNTTDFTITSYLNAGNTFAGAGTGLLFRTGIVNQLFNSVSTNSVIQNNASSEPLNDKELFFFMKPSIHLVAYDATIQGGMFIEDKGAVTYDVKPLVFSQEIGVNYAKKRWTMNFSITFKSREVKSSATAHKFGSAAIYYRFN